LFMPPRQIRPTCRALLLASLPLAALMSGAAARDLPATPEGAEKILTFLQTYIGKPAEGAPATTTISVESDDYLVSVDLAAMTVALKSAGVSYDPAVLKYKVFEQDDGTWRVEQTEVPAITGHSKQGGVTTDTSIAVSGIDSVIVVDPSISWVRSGKFNVDSMAIRGHAPGLEQAIDLRTQQGAISTAPSADGGLSSKLQQSIASATMSITVDRKAANPEANPDAKPVDISVKAGASEVAAMLDGARPRPLLDLWAFLVAHPSRSELAADEPALKTLLTAVLAGQTGIGEDIGTHKLSVLTPQGEFLFDEAKFGLSVTAAGAASRFGQHYAAAGLALPPGLVPTPYLDFVPTSFDVGFNVSGFDLTAAGAEAIADLHLAGDAPPISAEDKGKVAARLLGAGPLIIDISSSHVRAPQLDLSFEGQIRYLGNKPIGKITVHARNFDRTAAALKAFGPETERQLVPVIAMAKGLAKIEPDGVLTWVGELGEDRVMKVNGLPLGKAPF
jgi:hypothetical protein